jgi:TPR repeat protein
MPLRDLLKKKDRIEHDERPVQPSSLPQASEFTFVRTDTNVEEAINLPSFPEDGPSQSGEKSPKKGFHRFSRSPKVSPVHAEVEVSPPKDRKRFSQRLGLKDRSASTSSTHLPSDLPTIQNAYSERGDTADKEAQWEDRATRLASKSPNLPGHSPSREIGHLSLNDGSGSRSPSRPRSVSDAKSDVNIQEAIRLHEEGSLEAATDMFHRLAEQGNVLSQVLYGLSLRHGWGCTADPHRAVTYLSSAASNSAEIEAQALQAGMKKGGAAKGELVLAIFELANCFRHGWGVPVDKAAARQYYETAANLGDTDAMNEAAWCYLEGFGGKKDKVSPNYFQLSCALLFQCSTTSRPRQQIHKHVI